MSVEYYLNTDERRDVCLICNSAENISARSICDCTNEWRYHQTCMLGHFKKSKKCPVCKKDIKYYKKLTTNAFLYIFNILAIIIVSELMSYYRYDSLKTYNVVYSLVGSFIIQTLILYINRVDISFAEHIHTLLNDDCFNQCRVLEICSSIETYVYVFLMILSCVFDFVGHTDTINMVHYVCNVVVYYVILWRYFVHATKYLHIILSYCLLINLCYIYIFNTNKIMVPFIIIAYFVNLWTCYFRCDNENVLVVMLAYLTFAGNILIQFHYDINYNDRVYFYNIAWLFIPLFCGFSITYITTKSINY